ncbi:MAG TPA: aminotransferase class V-fold PLP-dependent enzyme [Ktedonobacterales bacterium]
MWDVLNDGAERAIAYLESLPERHIAPEPASVERLGALDTPLPEGPSDPRETIAALDSYPDGIMAMGSPRFFGFVIGGALPVTVAANWLATAWDQNAAYMATTPTVARVEEIALRWLVDLLGLPAGAGAGFVTGATVANFSCLLAARHSVLQRAGWDVEADGLFGAPAVSVIIGGEGHPTVFKSLGMAGFGRNRVIRVPVDDQGRMRADALPDITGSAIVITQAGNVNTGAFDPFEEIIPWAHAANAWVHVDGAFGLWAGAAPSTRHLLRGAEAADSWATDAHKFLNTPYDSGLAFVRQPDTLRAAMAITAAYLPSNTRRDPSDYTPELSRRARGVEVWAALHALGRAGVAELVERLCGCARRFADGMAAGGYPPLNDVEFNQALFEFGGDERTRRVISSIQEDGTCWCGVTVWQGRTAMRVSVSNWATSEADVDRSVETILRIARDHA